MTLKISRIELKNLVGNYTYEINGDLEEQKNGSVVADLFSNSEKYWKFFVTPSTNRMPGYSGTIMGRSTVDSTIKEMSELHYSILLNLIYANECLKESQAAFFENFYTHLSTVFDLAEDFLILVYNLILECKGEASKLKVRLTKRDFMDEASKYYDTKYPDDHQHYYSKGKFLPVKLFDKNLILKEYIETPVWSKYESLAMALRGYRNVVVHNKKLANRIVEGQIKVPKIDKVKDYKTWDSVFFANEDKIQSDFIVMKSQMEQNLKEVKEHLQNLWEKPISDMMRLLYEEGNSILCTKYNIEFVEGTNAVEFKNSTSNTSFEVSGVTTFQNTCSSSGTAHDSSSFDSKSNL